MARDNASLKSDWIGIREAADLLGTSPETVLAMIRWKKLPVALSSLKVQIWREAVMQRARRRIAHRGWPRDQAEESPGG
jgi:excisionase family DNA binding protein